MGHLENVYQAYLIKEIRLLLPGCHIQKLDANYIQGVPDLLILYCDNWAILEVKRKRPTKESDWRPNQREYIARFNKMGAYSACIYPENEEVILNELVAALGRCRVG